MAWGPIDEGWGDGWEDFDVDPFAGVHSLPTRPRSSSTRPGTGPSTRRSEARPGATTVPSRVAPATRRPSRSVPPRAERSRTRARKAEPTTRPKRVRARTRPLTRTRRGADQQPRRLRLVHGGGGTPPRRTTRSVRILRIEAVGCA
jgi:hypothetical protein